MDAVALSVYVSERISCSDVAKLTIHSSNCLINCLTLESPLQRVVHQRGQAYLTSSYLILGYPHIKKEPSLRMVIPTMGAFSGAVNMFLFVHAMLRLYSR